HNAKFDALAFYSAGIIVRGISFDTMIAAGLLVNEGQRIGLKYLSEYYLKESMKSFSDVVMNNGYAYFNELPLEEATKYAAADAHQKFRLYGIFKDMLQENQLDHLFYTIAMPTMHILIEMEKKGIVLDTAKLSTIDTEVAKEIERTYDEIITLL